MLKRFWVLLIFLLVIFSNIIFSVRSFASPFVSRTGNNPPIITSNEGGDNASISIPENRLFVTTVTATDEDDGQVLTYSISTEDPFYDGYSSSPGTPGTSDAALFSIDSVSGNLSFNTAPDYENPQDANLDNIYEVTVKVTDDYMVPYSDTQTILVEITDASEGGSSRKKLSLTDMARKKYNKMIICANKTALNYGENSVCIYPLKELFIFHDDLNVMDHKIDVIALKKRLKEYKLYDGEMSDFFSPALAVSLANYKIKNGIAPYLGTILDSITRDVLNGDKLAPVITSDDNFFVDENTRFVTKIQAEDDDVLTYKIVNDYSSDFFEINSVSGDLYFKNSPDYESDNPKQYFLDIQVSDGYLVANKFITINVVDVENDDCAIFQKDLRKGDSDLDVKKLQKFLNNSGYIVAIAGDGSRGNEVEYFGESTKTALKRYQYLLFGDDAEMFGFAGYLNQATRDKINNKLCTINSEDLNTLNHTWDIFDKTKYKTSTHLVIKDALAKIEKKIKFVFSNRYSSNDFTVKQLSEDGKIILMQKAATLKLVNAEDYSEIGSINIGNVNIRSVAISDTKMAVATANFSNSTLTLVDISTAGDFKITDTYDTPKGPSTDQYIYNLAFSKDENKLYFSANHGVYQADDKGYFRVMDISNPKDISVIGTLEINKTLKKIVVSKDGNTAYMIASSVEYGNSDVVCIDVSDPSNPILDGVYSELGDASNILLSKDGKILYVQDYPFKLKGIDLENIAYIDELVVYGLSNMRLSQDGSKIISYNDINGDSMNGNIKVTDVSNPYDLKSIPITLDDLLDEPALLGFSSDDLSIFLSNNNSTELRKYNIVPDYYTDVSALESKEAFEFSNPLISFNEVLGEGSEDNIKYQVSSDNGETWKYWNKSHWSDAGNNLNLDDEFISSEYEEEKYSSADEINRHIFSLDTDGGMFKWRAFLKSNGVDKVELDDVSVEYYLDEEDKSESEYETLDSDIETPIFKSNSPKRIQYYYR